MQKTGTTGRMLNTVFVLLLFCAFAGAMLTALLSGAGVYRSVNETMESQYTERTALAYLEAKLHHYDTADAVKLEPFADAAALALYEELDGVLYKTLIYHHDGYIKELFFEHGLFFRPEDGQKVLVAKDLQLSWAASNLLRLICISDDNREAELLVYLHSGEEVALYV